MTRPVIVDRDTVKKYLKLVKHGDVVGVRETQRILGLNSPGAAQRFLDRLVKIGLAEKRGDGKYVLSDKPFNVAGYIILKGYIIPKIIPVSVFSVAVASSYMLLSYTDIYTKILILLLLSPYLILSMDAIRLMRKLVK